jgi:hypothetical protein
MVVFSWALAGLGTLLAVVPAVHFFRRDMRTEKFLRVIETLMHAGDYSRVRKLFRANHSATVVRVTEAALALRLEATVLVEGNEADYRSAPETVPFEDRVREALEPTARAQLDRALRMAVMAAAGFALSAASLWPPWLTAAPLLGAVGVLLAFAALRMHASIRRGVLLALERLPPLVQPGDEMHRDEPANVEF